jgi:hypothetical protein
MTEATLYKVRVRTTGGVIAEIVRATNPNDAVAAATARHPGYRSVASVSTV